MHKICKGQQRGAGAVEGGAHLATKVGVQRHMFF